MEKFLALESHFVTNADRGYHDGGHRAWIIVEAENKEDALRILPSLYRANAKFTRISKTTRKEMDTALEKYHT